MDLKENRWWCSSSGRRRANVYDLEIRLLIVNPTDFVKACLPLLRDPEISSAMKQAELVKYEEVSTISDYSLQWVYTCRIRSSRSAK